MSGFDKASAPDEQGYLASVSDVMSGLIFVFIITLVVFALVLLRQTAAAEDEKNKLTGSRDELASLLKDLKNRLSDHGIEVQVVTDQGVLRLGERLLFASGRADLDQGGQQTVQLLASILGEVLPCYTARRGDVVCGQRGTRGRVEALFVEGHTDDRMPRQDITGFSDNWDLSVARAKTIYQALTKGSDLDNFMNDDSQPILSLSGYADRRSVKLNDSDEGRASNRRIDLRFVMMPPRGLLPPPAVETGRGIAR